MFKPQLLAITIAISGATFAGATLAQDQETEQLERKKHGRAELRDSRARHGRDSANRTLQRMDTNEDDLISLEEYLGDAIPRYSQTFARADRDGDGYVTQEELKPPRKGQRPQFDQAALQACLDEAGSTVDRNNDRVATNDTNGDGALSQDEFFAMLEQGALDRFALIDSDGDEQLTKEEIQTSRQEQNALRSAQRKALRSCIKEQRDLAQ